MGDCPSLLRMSNFWPIDSLCDIADAAKVGEPDAAKVGEPDAAMVGESEAAKVGEPEVSAFAFGCVSVDLFFMC